MYVCFYLKLNHNLYRYENVNLLDLSKHKFPSGRNRNCLTLVLDNGTTVNFCLSEICDLVVENHKEERHPYDVEARVLFVEDGQAYEKKF